MKTFLKGLIIAIVLIALACLVVFCIAKSKDMTFVDYIKSWFDAAKEAEEPIEEVAQTMACIFRR